MIIIMAVKVGTSKMDDYSVHYNFMETTISMPSFNPRKLPNHTNACSQIENFANNSKIEKSRNKSHAKISESTVFILYFLLGAGGVFGLLLNGIFFWGGGGHVLATLRQRLRLGIVSRKGYTQI